MPDDLSTSSELISSGVTLIAVFLGLRQWYERQGREPELSDADRTYFRRQDVRRGAGVAVMLILAAGIYVGSRIPPKIGNAPSLFFLQVWLAISALIVVMLFLAWLDWLATRRYARRQRQFLAAERVRILRETLRKEPKDRSSDSEQALDS